MMWRGNMYCHLFCYTFPYIQGYSLKHDATRHKTRDKTNEVTKIHLLSVHWFLSIVLKISFQNTSIITSNTDFIQRQTLTFLLSLLFFFAVLRLTIIAVISHNKNIYIATSLNYLKHNKGVVEAQFYSPKLVYIAVHTRCPCSQHTNNW